MSQSPAEEFGALAETIRPDLHRYCARLTGSVFDGEDIVQDALVRAVVVLQDFEIVRLRRAGGAPAAAERMSARLKSRR